MNASTEYPAVLVGGHAEMSEANYAAICREVDRLRRPRELLDEEMGSVWCPECIARVLALWDAAKPRRNRMTVVPADAVEESQ